MSKVLRADRESKGGLHCEVNYHPETGWLEGSRMQGVEGSRGRSEKGTERPSVNPAEKRLLKGQKTGKNN
jgi:hypothetical protein